MGIRGEILRFMLDTKKNMEIVVRGDYDFRIEFFKRIDFSKTDFSCHPYMSFVEYYVWAYRGGERVYSDVFYNDITKAVDRFLCLCKENSLLDKLNILWSET